MTTETELAQAHINVAINTIDRLLQRDLPEESRAELNRVAQDLAKVSNDLMRLALQTETAA